MLTSVERLVSAQPFEHLKKKNLVRCKGMDDKLLSLLLINYQYPYLFAAGQKIEHPSYFRQSPNQFSLQMPLSGLRTASKSHREEVEVVLLSYAALISLCGGPQVVVVLAEKPSSEISSVKEDLTRTYFGLQWSQEGRFCVVPVPRDVYRVLFAAPM